MEDRLVASGERWPDPLALGRPAPVGGGRDGAVVCREADQHGVLAVPLARELAEVQLSAPAHLRRPRVAQVRVVRPDDDLRARDLPLEGRGQGVERLGHVTVAQVPRRHLAKEHRASEIRQALHQATRLAGDDGVHHQAGARPRGSRRRRGSCHALGYRMRRLLRVCTSIRISAPAGPRDTASGCIRQPAACAWAAGTTPSSRRRRRACPC
jgi:hypothetical protein